MGVMWFARLSGRLFKIALALYIMMTLAMLGWTFNWPYPDVRAIKPADGIVCLGGGMDARGTLADATLTRIERCVHLYEAGLAPVVYFTGGAATTNGVTAGTVMGRFGVKLGLPASAVRAEGRSQSTLQNALFTLDMAQNATRLILVTEAFHLPRSWVSFHWARRVLGLPEMSFQLVKSENIRTDPVSGDIRWRMLARESLAIWFNGARALAYWVLPNPQVNWLR